MMLTCQNTARNLGIIHGLFLYLHHIQSHTSQMLSFYLPVCVCVCVCVCLVTSVMFNSSQPHGLQTTRLLCPWDAPGKSTGVGFHFPLQGIFLTQGVKPSALMSPALAGEFFLLLVPPFLLSSFQIYLLWPLQCKFPLSLVYIPSTALWLLALILVLLSSLHLFTLKANDTLWITNLSILFPWLTALSRFPFWKPSVFRSLLISPELWGFLKFYSFFEILNFIMISPHTPLYISFSLHRGIQRSHGLPHSSIVVALLPLRPRFIYAFLNLPSCLLKS